MAPSETTQDWDLRCSSASAAMNFAVKVSSHQLLASGISFSGKEKKCSHVFISRKEVGVGGEGGLPGVVLETAFLGISGYPAS